MLVKSYNYGTDVEHQLAAALVVTPVLAVNFCEVEELEETRRAGGGFGSTGK